jgi:hypothetical protein
MRRRTSRELTLSYFRALCSLVKFFDHIRRPSRRPTDVAQCCGHARTRLQRLSYEYDQTLGHEQ